MAMANPDYPFSYSHRCFVPSCDDVTVVTINASHTDFTIPKEHFSTNIFSAREKLDPCHRFRSKFEGEIHECIPGKGGYTLDIFARDIAILR